MSCQKNIFALFCQIALEKPTMKTKIAREQLLTVRLYDSEMKALSTLAKNEGAKNLSDFVRKLPENFPLK